MGLRARIWPGLPPRSIAFEFAVAVLGTFAVGVGATTPHTALPEPVVLVDTVLLGVALLLFRRTLPLVPFAVSIGLAALFPTVTAGALITSYAVGRYVGSWRLRAVAALAGCAAVVQPWTLGTLEQTVGSLAGAALVVLLPGAVGAWLRTRAQLLAAVTERAERAEAERELLARDAVLTERTRIAREMHDVVGHRVSLMVLQAGAIELAAGDRERVETLAGQVQTAGRQALEELRQMVCVLRAGEVDDGAPLGPQPGLEDLTALVADAREAGMTVELRTPPAASAPVDPVVGRAAYRIVQEALTNAGKHAPGAAVTVSVERSPEELVVRVVNGPSGTPPDSPHGGFGLVGLRERARTLGGRLEAGPRVDGGFRVEAVLPA